MINMVTPILTMLKTNRIENIGLTNLALSLTSLLNRKWYKSINLRCQKVNNVNLILYYKILNCLVFAFISMTSQKSTNNCVEFSFDLARLLMNFRFLLMSLVNTMTHIAKPTPAEMQHAVKNDIYIIIMYWTMKAIK